ncbi:MAG: PspC domain-containing protein [Bacteroidaceae bacterium]|nr:PspC domain-containing protein [Prevotellaceae bacterium]MDY5632659.1 PspC domain-containing protein [Bacteroidaceae bacterium]
MNKRLMRSKRDCMIFGVCGGLAEYLDVDPTLIRIAYLLFTFFTLGLGGILLYILMAIVMPVDRGY